MADGLRVQVKRHCSISPQGLALVFAALGAWLILPFAGLEVALLCAAFWAIARRAGND